MTTPPTPLTPDEQFATLNTSAWLDAFRVQAQGILVALATVHAHVPSFQFDSGGVPCQIVPQDDGKNAIANIGQGADGGWQYSIVAPQGWFTA